MNQFSQTDKAKIISRFQGGESVKSIANDLKVTYQKIYRIVKSVKQPRFSYHTFSNDIKNDIKTLYLSGKSTVFIAQKYHTTHKTIARVLEEYKIERVHNGVRKYQLDQHYFDNIDTPNKAYILGLLYADGSNSLSKSTISISLQECDVEILERIRIELKSQRPLEFLDYSHKHDLKYCYKNQYRLSLFSTHMCKVLNIIGMIPNKSLSLEFPKIDHSLDQHFIRGYFDGDGSFSWANKKYQPVITFTSTNSFCKKVQKIFERELSVSGGIYDASCHNNSTSVLSICGNKQTKKVLDWMYTDAELYMKRKYEKYIHSFYNDANYLIQA